MICLFAGQMCIVGYFVTFFVKANYIIFSLLNFLAICFQEKNGQKNEKLSVFKLKDTKFLYLSWLGFKNFKDSSRKCSAWKDFRFKPLSSQFPSCQAQPKPASQSPPKLGWDSLIISVILNHPPPTPPW